MNLQGRNLHQGLTGDDVRLLHTELALLNLVVPQNERLGALFGPVTVKLIQNLQKQHNIRVTGVVDAITAKAINGDVDALHPPTSTVSGRLYSNQRAGVGGLRIQVVDKNAGPDVLLAEGTTDAAGKYTLSYSTAKILKQGKSEPDIQVRVLSGEALIGASEVRYNATPTETLDVLLPITADDKLPSEHATLTGAIGAHFKGKLADLQEDGDRSDITYLANKTGWDARAVALAALADQFSAKTVSSSGAGPAIAAPFFYALFRAGLPINEDVLYQTDAATLTNIWNAAIAQGVISPEVANQIPKTAKRFQALSAQQLLTGPALAGVSPLKDMLHVSGVSGHQQQQQFAALYAANRNDMPAFWKAVSDAFGQEPADRLQLDGKLAFLTLNNASLMQALKKSSGGRALTDPVQLAHAGFHRADKWTTLLTANTVVPPEFSGKTPAARKEKYAAYLAAQVRLSYPTASVAQMVKAGDLPVQIPDQVSKFLTTHQNKFVIGAQPVQQYIARNNIEAPEQVIIEIKRIERLYQITSGDQPMAALLKRGIDSAYRVAHQDRNTFIQSLSADIGADQAAAIYDRSIEVHNAVLNVAVSYLTARNGLNLGASQLTSGGTEPAEGQILRAAPHASAAAKPDVISYPTLERLFGSMDFCSCDHCRSVLSPAAYLVDLLQFMDKDPLPSEKKNPQEVLFTRRPDIQHLPLTCENTNTALPYIDIVNETLEYYVANTAQKLSLKDYAGHDTGATATEDLMASPQYVMDTAYDIVRSQFFPPPLPFHQPLETLRLYFEKFDVKLSLAMEMLRKSEDVERGANPYGWRDVLMEELSLSRDEYRLLTDGSLTLRDIYGFADGATDDETIKSLSNAKQFARRVGVSYEELASILKTRFVNPNGDLIPKLERLSVSFKVLRDLHDGAITDADFDAMLPTGAGAPDPTQYGGDIKAWVKNPENFARIMAIITLAGPPDTAGGCNFDQFELRYSKPPAETPDNLLGVADFVRILRFVRLWKKIGWTMVQTDTAICALFRDDLSPVSPTELANLPTLDAGFNTLLPRLGVVRRVIKTLNLAPNRDLLPLLACWSDISIYGEGSLYRQLFLNPAILGQDPAFADDGHGNFPVGSNDPLLNHRETLRGALNLTAEEFDRITSAAGFNAGTKLTVTNITAIYRRGWLARKLRVSVREFLLLSSLTGIDPFTAPGPPQPSTLRFIRLVQSMKERSLRLAVALYLIWNQDLSGKSRPQPAKVTEFARTLRADFAAIDDQFVVVEDPGGNVARARMALVYGQETADAFFALVDGTIALNVSYTHSATTLEAGITAADDHLSYDSFQHRLSHVGLLTSTNRNALKNVAGVSADFQTAVDSLFARSEDVSGSFFLRFPELKSLFDAYQASTDSLDKKRAALLAAFSPELAQRRKRQQALQRLATAASVDVSFAQTILDPDKAPFPLHAANDPARSGLDDVTAIATPGLAAEFFHRDTATGTVDNRVAAAANLDYEKNSNPLPENPTPGGAVSGIWHGRIEAPESGYSNIVVEADPGAIVSLSFGGQSQPLLQTGTVWRNSDALQLKAGVLYDISLTVANVINSLRVMWETPKRAREVISGRYLYPPTVLPLFEDVYIRFLKSASLASALRLTANEIAHFANDASLNINGDGWLNVLTVSGDLATPSPVHLLKPFEALLDYARIKADLAPDDDSLLSVLEDPATATAADDSQLFTLTRWDRTSFNDVRVHLGGAITDFNVFRRVYDAFAVIRPIGVSGAALIRATTNVPNGGIVRDFQAALRARYAVADWRDLIQPINDTIRSLQRDALVAYILHQMRANPATASIDTPDKLFEYFLMDVQMEPCMQTSRIRHALSTAQLFIERCSMNLEPDVSPSSINAARWAWMKRYRVWEANRKVFLYPENWLEPELRDDKSPFFKEIESQLLQSDITEESATSAFLTYLAKLEEVAKLEPCGMHYVEPTSTQDSLMHVVARTPGAHRKYYYRRFEHGTWTAWAQIKLDIPDNPVIPVVWRDRLLLFWLRVLKKGPNAAPRPKGNRPLTEMRTTDIPPDTAVTLQAVLCWSEYYDGKWQAAKTSDINAPADLQESRLASLITPERLRATIHAKDEDKNAPLRIDFRDMTFFSFSAPVRPVSFLVYNTYSLPEVEYPQGPPPPARFRRLLGDSILYVDSDGKFTFRRILTTNGPTRVAEPTHELTDTWNAPYIYEDRHHAFLVTSEQQPVWIRDFPNYGVAVNLNLPQNAQMAPLVLPPPPPPKPTIMGEGSLDPVSIRRLVTEDAYISKGLVTNTPVTFKGRSIGPTGALNKGKALP